MDTGDKMNSDENKCKSEFVYSKHPFNDPVYKYILLKEYVVELRFNPKQTIFTTMFSLTPSTLGDETSCLHILEDYAWDGASGPTVNINNQTIRASCIHDALYKMIKDGDLMKCNRKFVDQELKRIMLEDSKLENYTKLGKWWDIKTTLKVTSELLYDGFRHIRANYYYAAVRVFGWLHI